MYFSAPSAAPVGVQGHNKSSTSIQVQWGNVPAADQNGITVRYTVTYKALPNGSPLIKEVNAPTMQTTLETLNKYTNYSITVFASTSKGGGNNSAPIIVITDEDSKFIMMKILFILLISDILWSGLKISPFHTVLTSLRGFKK